MRSTSSGASVNSHLSSQSLITAPSAPAATSNTQAGESWVFIQVSDQVNMAHTPEPAMTDTLTLDSASSVNLVCNPKLVHSVGPAKKPETIHTNGGPIQIALEGTMHDFGTVNYDEASLTNLLSLGLLTEKYRVTMDSAKDNAFLVHTPKKVVRFARN